jgi:hypothetical protein
MPFFEGFKRSRTDKKARGEAVGFKTMSRSISWLITNLLRSWHNSYDIFDHMLPVTEESLLIAKQPQKPDSTGFSGKSLTY